MLVAYALIYSYAPDLEPRRLRWITPGAAGGVAIWIVASIGFGIYIKNFSSYGAAYGAAGAVIVLLLWLWLSSCAFLFGAEVNAELERAERPAGRAAGGHGAADRRGRPCGADDTRRATRTTRIRQHAAPLTTRRGPDAGAGSSRSVSSSGW